MSLSQPAALAGQFLTPVLWVLVVGPALNRAFGGFTHQVDYTSYVSLGQIVFILPFSAMFAGLANMFDRDWGIMRELLVAPIHRAVIPLASTAAVLTVAAGQFAIIVGLALARGAHFATTPARLLTALAAAALLSAGVYGLAEFSSTPSRTPRHSARSSPPSAPPRTSCAAPSTRSPSSRRRQVAHLGPSMDAHRRAATLRPDGRHRSRPWRTPAVLVFRGDPRVQRFNDEVLRDVAGAEAFIGFLRADSASDARRHLGHHDRR